MAWRPPYVDPEVPLSERDYKGLMVTVQNRRAGAGCLYHIAWALCLTAMLALFMLAGRFGLGRWGQVAIIVGVVGLFAITGMTLRRVTYARNARDVRRELRRWGHDICVNCGYWLRGLPADTPACPECGARREEALPSLAQEGRSFP